jgi:pyruvate dehydrogenase E1 component alpha subunit
VYVIENNRYAMGTAVHRSSAQTDFSKRGVSFNIPGEQVDGMDVRAVREAGLRRGRVRPNGQGPYILEMQTYRYRGHSMSDPASTVQGRGDADAGGVGPDREVRRRLLEEHGVKEDELKGMDGQVRALVNEAAEFATTTRSRTRRSFTPTS